LRNLERGSCFPIIKNRHVSPKKNDVRHFKLSVPRRKNIDGSTISSKASENKSRSISGPEFKHYFVEDRISQVFAGVRRMSVLSDPEAAFRTTSILKKKDCIRDSIFLLAPHPLRVALISTDPLKAALKAINNRVLRLLNEEVNLSRHFDCKLITQYTVCRYVLPAQSSLIMAQFVFYSRSICPFLTVLFDVFFLRDGDAFEPIRKFVEDFVQHDDGGCASCVSDIDAFIELNPDISTWKVYGHLKEAFLARLRSKASTVMHLGPIPLATSAPPYPVSVNVDFQASFDEQRQRLTPKNSSDDRGCHHSPNHPEKTYSRNHASRISLPDDGNQYRWSPCLDIARSISIELIYQGPLNEIIDASALRSYNSVMVNVFH
jgi:hypothetical protein